MQISTKKRLPTICAAVLLLPVTTLAALRVSASLFQKRAEKLFSRVTALDVDKSTFDDVQALTKVYRSESGIDSDPCNASECTLHIVLGNFQYRHDINWKFLRILAIKPARLEAQFTVKDGKVSRIYSAVYYQSRADFWVGARVMELDAFSHFGECRYPVLRHHPEYYLTMAHLSGSMFGSEIDTEFTPMAQPRDLATLLEVDWNCLTSTAVRGDGSSPVFSMEVRSFMPAGNQLFVSDRVWALEHERTHAEFEFAGDVPHTK